MKTSILLYFLLVSSAQSKDVTSLLGFFRRSPCEGKLETDPQLKIFQEVIKILDNKKRTGAIDLFRSLGKSQAEAEAKAQSIWEHTLKLRRAAEIYFKHYPEETRNKIFFVIYIHDFAEYVLPDYPPNEIKKSVKFLKEKSVMEKLVKKLGPDYQFVLDAWLEYEAKKEPWTKLVSQLDKMDALVYTLNEVRELDKVQEYILNNVQNVTDTMLSAIRQTLIGTIELEGNKYHSYFDLLSLIAPKYPE
jgi:5'-deoxynucleotidase YfbR-like HD superfamily hydrolase